MRRELRRIVTMLTKRLKPPSRLGAVMLLPDDGSGDDLDPRVRGDGNPDLGIHTILLDGSCRNCSVRHNDEPDGDPPAPAADPSTPLTEEG